MWSQALGRAPVGSVPPKAAKGEAAAAAAQIKLGCNIQTAAGLLLQLLFEVCGRSQHAYAHLRVTSQSRLIARVALQPFSGSMPTRC